MQCSLLSAKACRQVKRNKRCEEDRYHSTGWQPASAASLTRQGENRLVLGDLLHQPAVYIVRTARNVTGFVARK